MMKRENLFELGEWVQFKPEIQNSVFLWERKIDINQSFEVVYYTIPRLVHIRNGDDVIECRDDRLYKVNDDDLSNYV